MSSLPSELFQKHFFIMILSWHNSSSLLGAFQLPPGSTSARLEGKILERLMDVVTGDFDANQDKPVNEKPVSIFL